MPGLTGFDFPIPAQPTETACGPTCLHAVYRHFGDNIPLEQVMEQTREVPEGGTLDAFLAAHALRRGYRATIYVHNLKVFDPTWFTLPPEAIIDKLRLQMEVKRGWKLDVASEGYIEFLELGGRLKMEDLTGRLLRRYLTRGVPILTGLSSTWLYRAPRELPDPSCTDDDVRGEPVGHFVVLHGYYPEAREVLIADPYGPNPFSRTRNYRVGMERLIASVLLGVVSFDCNLLVIEPGRRAA